MQIRVICLALAAAIAAGASSHASAAEPRRDWRDRDIHRFHEHDFERWRTGRWVHARHGGRLGWWWIVDGTWYYYPAPVYPYPDPFQPPVVVAAPPPGPPSFYYYCGNPAGYYPYVPQCPSGWRAVPAAPPG
jgi:hypothetical protein